MSNLWGLEDGVTAADIVAGVMENEQILVK